MLPSYSAGAYSLNSPQDPHAARRRKRLHLCHAAIAATAILPVALIVRRVLIVVTVAGTSMEPWASDGDTVLAVRTNSHLIRVGAVVLARPPLSSWVWQAVARDDRSRASARFIIKRVGALPGAPPPGHLESRAYPGPTPRGHVFLVGDGPSSIDSRVFGPVPQRNIVGLVVARLPARSSTVRSVASSL